jgi:glycosyltransferase involved in cell wall biosynthesis
MLRAPHTGSGQYSAALIAALRALPETDVLLLSSESIASEPDAIVVQPPTALRSARARKVWWEQIGVGRAARAVGVDVVHLPYFAAPLRQHLPYIVTVHDVIPLLFPAYAGGRAMHTYLRLVSAGARRAALVIADSECSRRDAIRVLGLDAARVTAIPLAVGPEFQPAADPTDIATIRARLGLDGKRIIFNVAGLDVRKNVATLLRAFAQAAEQLGPDAMLVIGGKAHGNSGLYPDLAPLARDLGIADRVLLPGSLTQKEKIALYHAAACYAAPSRYEGFGLTPLEAMACGTPVVAADASCTREVVGDAALLVGPDDVGGFADALISVLTDDAVAGRMREAGLRQAAFFSWQRTAAATLAVYQRAIRAPVGEPQTRREQPVEVTQ